MKKIKSYLKFIQSLVLFLIVLLVLVSCSNGIANVMVDYTFENTINQYEAEIIYPERFIIPVDAKRKFPFYMSNNLKNQEDEVQENKFQELLNKRRVNLIEI